jgi:Crp-like helix-turn-helix domain
MLRLEAIGINGAVIPMTQVDLADAANLSAVHMNRMVKDLRELGVLSKNRRGTEVVHREGLVDIAKFDSRYLNILQLLIPRQPRSLRPPSDGIPGTPKLRNPQPARRVVPAE